jgi:hypothetical protein
MSAVSEIERVNHLLTLIKHDLGDPSTWDFVRYYPRSLAMGVIDAIWSVRVKSTEVIAIVARYAAYRRARGANPDTDTASDLLATFAQLGLDGWIEHIGNHQRTYASPAAPEKAEAVYRAADILVGSGVQTPADLGNLVTHPSERTRQVEAAWRAIPGETSGLTYRRLALVTGAYELPPSPWMAQFMASALGGDVTSEDAGRLLDDAASRLGVAPMALRQAIWYREMAAHPSPKLASGA